VCGFWLPAVAHAHVELVYPPPRLGGQAGGNELKTAPCGQRVNGRTETVTMFEPGETITVRWNEYIDHPSYYRVAFDVDGDDAFTVRPNADDVVREEDDPVAAEPLSDVILQVYADDESGFGTDYSSEVTLPDVECENCTLQIIQFMYDKLGNDLNDEYYFQCADIILRGSGGSTSTSTTGEDTGSADTEVTSASSESETTSEETSTSESTTEESESSSSSESETSGAASESDAGSEATGSEATSDEEDEGDAEEDESDDDPSDAETGETTAGCACSAGGPSQSPAAWFFGLGLLWVRATRRRVATRPS